MGLVTGLVTGLVWPMSLAAQGIPEAEGGARLEAGVDLRLEWDNGNPEFRTLFDLDLITATRTQRLAFSGNLGFVVPLDDVERAEFRNPSYGVDFLRETGRLRLSVLADYTETDIDTLSRLEDDPVTGFDERILTQSEDGTRERAQAQVALELGLNDPVGGELLYRFRDVSYVDETDPNLEDRRLDEFNATVRFDITSVFQISLDGQWRQINTEGIAPREEERTRLGTGVIWEAAPNLTLEGSVAYVATTTDTTRAGVTTRAQNEGVNLIFGLELDRPNGGYSFDASRLLNNSGPVGRIEVARDLDLARGAAVSVSFGATELPSGAVEGLGGVTFERETARGNLFMSLTHDATLDRDNEEVRRTFLAARYRTTLARGAQLNLAGRLTDSAFITGPDADIASARFTVSYTHPLTPEWGLGAGLIWQVTREDGVADDIDNRVFLSLERRFTLRR